MNLKLTIYFQNKNGKDLVAFPECYMQSKLPGSYKKEIEGLMQRLQDAGLQIAYPGYEYNHTTADIESSFRSANEFAFFLDEKNVLRVSGAIAIGERRLLEDALVAACAMCNVTMPESLVHAIAKSKEARERPPKPMLSTAPEEKRQIKSPSTASSDNSTKASSVEESPPATSTTTLPKKSSWFSKKIR